MQRAIKSRSFSYQTPIKDQSKSDQKHDRTGHFKGLAAFRKSITDYDLAGRRGVNGMLDRALSKY
jgi:hypothetical protein